MGHRTPEPDEPVVIDCDEYAVRGPGCRDCVVSVLLGAPDTLWRTSGPRWRSLPRRGWRCGCGWKTDPPGWRWGWQVRLRTATKWG